jgi:hypothetical protein
MAGIKVRHTKPGDPKGGVVAYSDGNDDAEVYISPKGLTRITVSHSVHASPVQMLAWITALTEAADAERRRLLEELAAAE